MLVYAFVLISAFSCSKSDSKSKQQVEFFYQIEFSFSNPDKLSDYEMPQPEVLYKKIMEELSAYIYDYNFPNNVYTPHTYQYKCDIKDFNKTIQKYDSIFVERQQAFADNFMKYFYKKRIEPLLSDKEKYGKGEFTIRVSVSAIRHENVSYTNRFGGDRENFKTYKPYGTVKGVEINSVLGEPTIIEIKYSNL